MISHCANPGCNKPFHYLRGGRLYRFDTASPRDCSQDVANAVCAITPTRAAVFFWLCKDCSSKVSLEFNGQQVWVTPLGTAARGSNRAPVVALGEIDTDRRRLAGDRLSQSGH
jgi:hypothetical protein